MRREIVFGTLMSVAVHWAVLRLPLGLPLVSGISAKPKAEIELSFVLPPSPRAPEKTVFSEASHHSQSKAPEIPESSPAPSQRSSIPPKVSKVLRPAAPKSGMAQKSSERQAPVRATATGSQNESMDPSRSDKDQGFIGSSSGEEPSGRITDHGPEAEAGSSGGMNPVAGKPELQKALPRYGFNPKPPYPDLARRRGYEGTVILSVLVSRDGSAASVRVAQSSGYSLLDRSALETVAGWRFVPAKLGGEPVEMEVEVPVRFQLER